MHLGQASCVPNLPSGVALEIMTPSTTADSSRTLAAITDRQVGSIAADFEQFMP
jgi:hypothetical protein